MLYGRQVAPRLLIVLVGYSDGVTLRALLRRKLGRGVRELRRGGAGCCPSSTGDGKTVAHVGISAWNKNAQGVFEVHMQAPEGAGANAQVDIRGFTQNGVTYPDITASLAQARLIDFNPVSATGTQFFAYDEVDAADLGTPYDAYEPKLAPAQNDLLPGWF